jgi:hypothetical protein
MKTPIKFGLISAVAVSTWVLLEYLLGFHTTRYELGQYTGFGAAIFPVACTWVALTRLRAAAGALTFGRGLAAGAVVAAISSAGTGLFMVVYYRFINPGWLATMRARETAAGQAADRSPEQLNAHLESLAAAASPAGILMVMIGSFLIGLLIAAIIALVLRRPPARA